MVGVGGSGKRSLCRLAAFTCGFEVHTPQLSAGFGVGELKEQLKDIYKRAGVKPAMPLVFLMVDSQITDERFLVYVNDMLSSGIIPDLFPSDEYDSLLASLRPEAKAAGVADSKHQLSDFFLSRVRANLHLVLAFSPVGAAFRARCRKFPGIINCTSIDWFWPWPRDALVSVAQSRLQGIELGSDESRDNLSHHMAEVHLSVIAASSRMEPKSGLEEQLLAQIVAVEEPQLQEQRHALTQAFNTYKIQLLSLEDQLLERLANAPADILRDVHLITGLEATKAKALEIQAAVEAAQETEMELQTLKRFNS